MIRLANSQFRLKYHYNIIRMNWDDVSERTSSENCPGAENVAIAFFFLNNIEGMLRRLQPGIYAKGGIHVISD